MSDCDVYGVGGEWEGRWRGRRYKHGQQKEKEKSDRNGRAGKKHLLKKVQINKQKKNTNNVGACVTGWQFEMDSPWENTPRRRTLISITIHPEAFRTFLIAHNHRLANTRTMCE